MLNNLVRLADKGKGLVGVQGRPLDRVGETARPAASGVIEKLPASRSGSSRT